MNALNTSNDDVVECPLCMEPLEVDDLNFYPCTCGYQICRFCWHRIRTDENELCPACRKAYPENPADFTPLSQEQISALKAEKRLRDQQRKQKITENRKHLANVRVVQKNLVFVVGLPPRLADADILKKHEYFGKYGKIHKVVINPSTTYAGVQGPSASAYVTYIINNDALRAIQSVNNIMIDGRLIKTSLGTTKYCSHFMKNQQCPKTDCMYLHELGDPEASFTKEEMHQGKHQEYEKRLHDTLIAATAANPGGVTPPGTNGNVGVSSTTIISSNIKNGDSKLTNGTVNAQNQEAWPSLSVSPVNNKDSSIIVNSNAIAKISSKSGKENKKHDKTKSSNGKKKTQNNNKENSSNINNPNTNHNQINGMVKDSIASDLTQQSTSNKKDKLSTRNDKDMKNTNILNADDEINLIEYLETSSDGGNSKNGDTRSFSTSSNNSESTSSLSESTSGKSSPGSFPDHPSSGVVVETTNVQSQNILNISSSLGLKDLSPTNSPSQTIPVSVDDLSKSNNFNNVSRGIDSVAGTTTINNSDINNLIDTTACLSKLNLFDDNNSFFSSSSFQPLLKMKLDSPENRVIVNNQLNSTISSQLPDLLNGIDNYQNSSTNNVGVCDGHDDWEDAFKMVMLRNSKQQLEDQLQQEEFFRSQEMRKRNNMINSPGMISNGAANDFNNGGIFNISSNADINRMSQAAMFQLHQDRQQQNNMHNNDILANSMFGTNMSKFFDFHKNQQQQQHHQHFIGNGHGNAVNEHRDHLSMAALLNSQFVDQQNGHLGQQKPGLLNKYDQIGSTHNHNLNINLNSNLQHQPVQNRIPSQFAHNISADDDLGFDPFIETQKGLAEMMENEILQQSQTQNSHNKNLLDNGQRTRMPPPGFNHMNAFGFGVPRPQSSKILPFMNVNNGPLQHPTQQQNNWNQHMSFQQQQHQQQFNEQMHQQNQNGSGNHNKGFGNIPDWTAMDPAILSFRQFPSFSSHQHQQQQQINPADNMFMQHLNQQNLQQSQGFGHLGVNLPNNLLNPQQNAQAQIPHLK